MFDQRIVAIGLGLSLLIVGTGLGWGVKILAEPCNIQMLYLNGILTASVPEIALTEEYANSMPTYTASQSIELVMKPLERSSTIDGVILTIDSPGGSAVAGEEFARAFERFEKPIVSVIRSSGVSAAYWAALGTDKIFASANSQVGSIGATFSYTDTSKKNADEGITYNVVSSGKFKDLGSSNKPLTAEERALLERDVKIIEKNFIDAVSAARALAPEEVKKMADGSFMLGVMAKEKGLIDEIGGIEEAREYLESQIGYAKICEE
ncbi:S49 family peptidase [Candidatus Kaiserbacteria bacterium]|nr:S49 family peptidase [Candidatus Kaiserbacteria bacterium]